MKNRISYRTTITIRIVIAALAVCKLVAAEITPHLLQQGNAASRTRKQEQSTIQSLRGNLQRGAASSQHNLDQENQCLRSGDKCSNAALEE